MTRRVIVVSVVFLLSMLVTLPGHSQEQKKMFRSPVNFPVSLSGSFGEIRKNHFHSGIDIRTQGVQGKPVFAVADGYVARVNVSPGGFGKALYIAHPNGYTSLYGHLKSYAGATATYVRAQQYKKESFALDMEVPAGLIKVKKGEIIAYSGNSGASGGPHLHFEIRETKSQEIIDPLDFGFMKSDGIEPKISWIKIYPMDENASVNRLPDALLIPVAGSKGLYHLKKHDTIILSGKIIFGIETSDNAEGGLKTGVHAIDLSIDGLRIFSQNVDRFAFSETRYINSLIDYPALIRGNHKLQRSYVAPNNKLSVYKDVKNRGIVTFSDSRKHKIQYTVKDAFGNAAVLVFWVKSNPPKSNRTASKENVPAGSQLFTYKADNHFEQPGLKFDVPKEAVYEEFNFTFRLGAPHPGCYADVYDLHNELTPLFTFCTLSIKANNLPADLASKALIVSVGPNNRFVSRGGKYDHGWVTTQIREFGNFTITVDTSPPIIRPVNIFNNKKITKQSSILIKISDNLSGIKSYEGRLNGKWILMDYDLKSNLLTYTFDDLVRSGSNQFVLTVSDAVGNTSRYEATLIR
ncbi:MAG: M23 family metallopeptidase [Bacteroidales bacterium]|nr:M23 family metallopeptidase [Bacteroidales bacterium]